MKHEESNIQRNCVRWFRLQYNEPQYLIFAVPNGGNRNRITGIIMKGEGVRAGIPDLIICTGGKILFIEMKSSKGILSDTQREVMAMLTGYGFEYAVCHSFDEFRECVIKHIGISK